MSENEEAIRDFIERVLPLDDSARVAAADEEARKRGPHFMKDVQDWLNQENARLGQIITDLDGEIVGIDKRRTALVTLLPHLRRAIEVAKTQGKTEDDSFTLVGDIQAFFDLNCAEISWISVRHAHHHVDDPNTLPVVELNDDQYQALRTSKYPQVIKPQDLEVLRKVGLDQIRNEEQP
jgi:hypothetical protein